MSHATRAVVAIEAGEEACHCGGNSVVIVPPIPAEPPAVLCALQPGAGLRPARRRLLVFSLVDELVLANPRHHRAQLRPDFLDLVRGSWAHQGQGAGRNQHYSFANTNPRWLLEGPSSGWTWIFSS